MLLRQLLRGRIAQLVTPAPEQSSVRGKERYHCVQDTKMPEGRQGVITI